MLKKFFFQVLTSFMGAWIAIVLSGVVAVITAFALIGSLASGQSAELSKDSVLRITLEGTLEERENVAELDFSSLTDRGEVTQTVETLVAAIKEAKTNKKIKAIYLDCRGMSGAPASFHAVREALEDFKQSKKKIYAYSDSYAQGDYFLASLADEIVLNPAGALALHGMGGTNIFYKAFFDKIGIEIQAVRVGKGKAAVEPYTSTEMSEVARSQSMSLMDTLWLGMRREMSDKSRGITPALIDTLINRDLISLKPAKFALDHKLVTGLEYRHRYEDKIAKACGQKDGLEQVITPSELVSSTENPMASVTARNQVAVLYACGAIDDFMGSGGINSSDVVDEVLSLAKDDKVKALVLRVNSPGGSAYGSEQMWEALETFKKTGKPFIVSMGDYAASGGYYISCGAQRIFADPFTITGSIGIFGMIPNVNGLLLKLGMNPQMVATNPDAVFPNLLYPLTDRQLAAMQEMVQNGYDLFVKRCADGRHTTVAKIEEIADGRPLPASAAISCGLVDELGSLDKAIAYAAGQAKLKKWEAVAYPNPGNAFENFMKSLEKQSEAVSLVSATVSDPAALAEPAMEAMRRLQGRGAIQARMPVFRFSY